MLFHISLYGPDLLRLDLPNLDPVIISLHVNMFRLVICHYEIIQTKHHHERRRIHLEVSFLHECALSFSWVSFFYQAIIASVIQFQFKDMSTHELTQ